MSHVELHLTFERVSLGQPKKYPLLCLLTSWMTNTRQENVNINVISAYASLSLFSFKNLMEFMRELPQCPVITAYRWHTCSFLHSWRKTMFQFFSRIFNEKTRLLQPNYWIWKEGIWKVCMTSLHTKNKFHHFYRASSGKIFLYIEKYVSKKLSIFIHALRSRARENVFIHELTWRISSNKLVTVCGFHIF